MRTSRIAKRLKSALGRVGHATGRVARRASRSRVKDSLLALEPRILLDAAAVATPSPAAAPLASLAGGDVDSVAAALLQLVDPASLEAEGATNTWGGLSEALRVRRQFANRLDGHEADELFLLSDGIPTAGEVKDAQLILDLVAEVNRFARLRIHTVDLARELHPRDHQGEEQTGMRASDFLHQLAGRNGGRCATDL